MTSEAELDAQVRQLCEIYGWRRYHTYRSKRSPAGFPDLVLVRPPRIIFAELKSDDGKMTDEQREWIGDFQRVALAYTVFEHDEASQETYVKDQPIAAYVWRPRDLDEIARALAKR